MSDETRQMLNSNMIKTPDYDPRKNSRFINWLLNAGIDGKYQREEKLCVGVSASQLHSKTITRAQFPLRTFTSLTVTALFWLFWISLGVLAIAAIFVTSWSSWILIPLAVIFLAFAIIVGIFFGHKAGLHHRYVLIELEGCDKCQKEHFVLYDAITKMKRRRFGRYTNPTCETMDLSKTRRSYEFIEEIFEEMPKQLGPPIPCVYDCRDWADEMFNKIA